MLNKIIENLKASRNYQERHIGEATEIYNNGWSNLKDETVIMMKGNLVAVKKGDTIVKYEMADFNVREGKLDGNIIRTLETIEIPEEKKNVYLAQAIITRYYTIKSI